MSHGLSKSGLQAFRQCPKRLWLAVHRPDLQDISPETEQRLQPAIYADRSAEPRAVLVDYCRRDTLALVRLAAFLAEYPTPD